MAMLDILEGVGRWYLRARGLQSRHVQTPVGKMHVLEWRGSGKLPTLVVLHGISSNSVPFGSLILKLRGRFSRILAPDAIGHGLSEEPSVADPELLLQGLLAWADQELDEPAFVLGNSLGGGMALRLAVERPAKVRGLILTSPGGAYMEKEELRSFLQRFDMTDRRNAQAFVNDLYFQPPFYNPVASWFVQGVFLRPWLRRLIDNIGPQHLLLPEQLRNLTMPVLLLWGRADRLMLPQMLSFFRLHLPGHAQVEEPEDFGHIPHLERPGKLASRLLHFVNQVQAA